MTEKGLKTFCPKNRHEWRAWLQEYHNKEKSVWVIFHKKKPGAPTITWSEAVDEALCFGWIDSTVKPVDEERYMRFFSVRKVKSGWSRINKEKVQHLMAEGVMTQAGLSSIETAKQNGSWTKRDDVEALITPPDLEQALVQSPEAKSYFQDLAKSDKKILLHWVMEAKRPETRQNRIGEIVECADQSRQPKNIKWTKKAVE